MNRWPPSSRRSRPAQSGSTTTPRGPRRPGSSSSSTAGCSRHTTSAAAEAVAPSEALGLDSTLFTRTIAGGGLDSAYLQTKAKAITDRDFTANFNAAMAAKDASLIVQAGRDAGLNLPVAAAIAEQFARAVDAG